ncbi:MAG: hypothetical protein FJ225_04875 [Lentisphaerae bacterium]|nr:hypothetical protein [Lentisphaerota bacterium]
MKVGRTYLQLAGAAAALALLCMGCEWGSGDGGEDEEKKDGQTEQKTEEQESTQTESRPNVTGDWEFELTPTAGVPVEHDYELTQTGASVDGEWDGSGTGGDVSGTVNDDGDVKLVSTVDSMPGHSFKLEGTVSGNGEEMNGTWTSTWGPKGTWKAKKE